MNKIFTSEYIAEEENDWFTALACYGLYEFWFCSPLNTLELNWFGVNINFMMKAPKWMSVRNI